MLLSQKVKSFIRTNLFSNRMKHYIYTLLILSICSLANAQTSNTWTKKSDFSGLKRSRAVAFSINDIGYVGTGVDTAEIVHNDFWQYDPTLDTWAQVADLPASVRRNAVGFAINNKGYVGTGMDMAEASMSGSTTLNDFWEYDPALNAWTQKANYPGGFGFGVYFATAFVSGSKGYVCCGKLGPNDYINQLWEYKPAIDQWAQLPGFPGGVRYQLPTLYEATLPQLWKGRATAPELGVQYWHQQRREKK